MKCTRGVNYFLVGLAFGGVYRFDFVASARPAASVVAVAVALRLCREGER